MDSLPYKQKDSADTNALYIIATDVGSFPHFFCKFSSDAAIFAPSPYSGLFFSDVSHAHLFLSKINQMTLNRANIITMVVDRNLVNVYKPKPWWKFWSKLWV